jgi:solute:Na+ symporter, SSS family
LLNLLGPGLKGLSFAALTAAIVASLAGKANSIATIFTLDIYKKYMNREAGEDKQVSIGRWVIIVAMIIGVLVAPQLQRLEQGFQFIQDFTGLISPGVVAIFLLGFFWKPFLDRMGWVFLILTGLMVVVSLLDPKSKDNPKALNVDPALFRTSPTFTIGALLVLGVLSALYIVFW